MRNLLIKIFAATCLTIAVATHDAAAARQQQQSAPPATTTQQSSPAEREAAPAQQSTTPPTSPTPPPESTTTTTTTPAPAEPAVLEDGPGFSDATTAAAGAARAAAKGDAPLESSRVGVVAIFNRTERPLSEGILRERLINFLDEGGLDAISIEASAPDEVAAEARSKQCALILYTEIVALKQSAGSKLGAIFGSQSATKNDARVELKLVAAKDLATVHQSNVDFKEEGGEEAGSVTTALESGAKEVAAGVTKKQ